MSPALGSVSLFNKPFAAFTVNVMSSEVDLVSALADGESCETGTLTVTVALSHKPSPSQIWYTNVSVPVLKPALGV